MNTTKLTINTLLVTLMLVTTPMTNNTAAANSSNEPNLNLNLEMDLQTLVCYINNFQFSIDVAMPTHWSMNEIELESARICNSIQETEMTYQQAVCDTDMNCERFDRYKSKGVMTVFTAPNHLQNVEKTVLEITCYRNNSTWYTDRIQMLNTICQNTPLDTLNYLKEEADKNNGYTSDLVLTLEEIEYLINTNWAYLTTKHNQAPRTGEFLIMMKKHPELVASGYFITNSKRKSKGLVLTQIQTEFAPKTISIDIINFCEGSTEFYTHNKPGIMSCYWD